MDNNIPKQSIFECVKSWFSVGKDWVFTVGTEKLTKEANNRLIEEERRFHDIDSTIDEEGKKFKNGRSIHAIEAGYERIMSLLEHTDYSMVREMRNMSNENLIKELFSRSETPNRDKRRPLLAVELFKRHTLAQKESNLRAVIEGISNGMQQCAVALIPTYPLLGIPLMAISNWGNMLIPGFNEKRNSTFHQLTAVKLEIFLLEMFRRLPEVEREKIDNDQFNKLIGQLCDYNKEYNRCRSRFWTGVGVGVVAYAAMLYPAVKNGYSVYAFTGLYAGLTVTTWIGARLVVPSRVAVSQAYQPQYDEHTRKAQGQRQKTIENSNFLNQFPEAKNIMYNGIIEQSYAIAGCIKNLGNKWISLCLKKYGPFIAGTYFLVSQTVLNETIDINAEGKIAMFLSLVASSLSTYLIQNSLIDKEISARNFSNLTPEISHNQNYDIRTDTKTIEPNADTIILKNIAYAHRDAEGNYQSGHLFTTDKSFEISKGITILGGASGTGKSRLIMLLTHGDNPVNGNIYIGNKESGSFADLRTLEQGALPKKVVVGCQKPGAIDTDVATLVNIGQKESGVEKVDEAYREKVYTALKLKYVKEGEKPEEQVIDLNRKIDSKFSGGEMNRLVVAQTLLSGRPIMIFDEPTAALDPKFARVVVELINDAAKDKTIVYVSHNPEELKHMNHAKQALDIDQKTITRYDLTSESVKSDYIEFVKDRKSKEEAEKQSKMLTETAKNPEQATQLMSNLVSGYSPDEQEQMYIESIKESAIAKDPIRFMQFLSNLAKSSNSEALRQTNSDKEQDVDMLPEPVHYENTQRTGNIVNLSPSSAYNKEKTNRIAQNKSNYRRSRVAAHIAENRNKKGQR